MSKLTSSIFALSFFTAHVMADCLEGVRDANAVDKQYYIHTMTAIKQAIPPVDQGWTRVEETAIDEPKITCVNSQYTPRHVSYSTRWKTAADKQNSEALNSAITAGMNTGESDEVKLAKLQERAGAIGMELQVAASAGNMAKVNELQAETQKIAEEMQRIMGKKNQQVAKNTENLLPKDTEVLIRVLVNSLSEMEPRGTPINVPGAAFAYRINDERRKDMVGWEEGSTAVYLGPWEKRDQGEYNTLNARVDPSRAETSTQVVTLHIRADKTHAEQLLKQINLSVFQAMVQPGSTSPVQMHRSQ